MEWLFLFACLALFAWSAHKQQKREDKFLEDFNSRWNDDTTKFNRW